MKIHQEVYEDYIKFDTERAENTKSVERQKTSFPKEQIENADFYNPIYIKGALSSPRQFWPTESPLKMMKNAFLFHLRCSFRSQDI